MALQTADAIASICSPLDLTESGKAIGQGLNRQIYTRMFLRSMKPKALAKWTSRDLNACRVTKLRVTRSLRAPGSKRLDVLKLQAKATKPWLGNLASIS